jgi:hypothetical protein
MPTANPYATTKQAQHAGATGLKDEDQTGRADHEIDAEHYPAAYSVREQTHHDLPAQAAREQHAHHERSRGRSVADSDEIGNEMDQQAGSGETEAKIRQRNHPK